jgi:hypothetical protein
LGGYLSVLFDIAAETSDPVAFKREVESFFFQSCTSREQEWQAARPEVQSGNLELDNLKTIKADEFPPGIDVQIINEPSSAANPETEDFVALADAA